MSDAASTAAAVRKIATSEMTDKHIFALLAFADKPGSKEKFDKQFGKGAADRVLSSVSDKNHGVSLTVTADFNAVQSALVEMAGAVAHIEGLARDFSKNVDERFEHNAARNDALSGRYDDIARKVADLEERLSDVGRKIADLAVGIESVVGQIGGQGEAFSSLIKSMSDDLSSRIDDLVRDISEARTFESSAEKRIKALETRPEPKTAPTVVQNPKSEEKKKPLQLRVTQPDENGNISAVEVV